MSSRIRFDEIPSQGLRLELTVSERELELDEHLLVPLTARLELARQGANRVLVRGWMSAVLELQCDRCLASYRQPLDEELLVLLELRGGRRREEDARDSATPDAPETMQLDGPVVDVHEVLRQQVYLALPVKRLCRKDCPGLCLGCGALLGSRECRCSERAGNSPFSVLGDKKTT